MKPKILSDVCLAVCCNGCILTEAGTDKERPWQNPLVKNFRELRQTPFKHICMYSCTTKKLWGPRYVTYFGGPRCVTYFVGPNMCDKV